MSISEQINAIIRRCQDLFNKR